jgi:type I restriction enzyme S subunit
MNAETLLENFEVLAEAPGGISRLRELVIALAVSGQIVKMRMPDDDTVDELLQCTADEVDPYPEMSEKRFDIPLHWTWVPLASIARHQLGKMLNTGKMKGERVKYLRSVNVRQDGRIDLSDVKEMLIPIDELEKYSVKLDDVFVNEGGDVGRNAIWLIESDERFAFQNQLHRLRPICGVSSRYLQLVFRDAKSRGVIAELSSGVTIQHFSASSIRKLAIPLPPLAEQKRIVAKVDELMALCDQLEQQQKHRDNLRTSTRKSAIDAISTATTPEELEAAWKRINNNWDVIADTPESVGLLRELILDLAIRGKIVAQISSSNSVSSLIQEMAHQKMRDEIAMSRQGKGSEFTRKITLHNLPLSWHKGFLGDIALIVMGNSPPGDSYRDNEEGVPLINGPVEFSKPQLGPTIRTKFTVAPTYMCKGGDLLVCVRGATTGRTNVSAFDACIGRGVALVRGWQSQKFINLFMWNIGSELLSKGKGTTFPSISFDDLAGLEIGLPPIEEQELIIKRVDELMALCDQLESELKSRSQVAEKFARSVVSAA